MPKFSEAKKWETLDHAAQVVRAILLAPVGKPVDVGDGLVCPADRTRVMLANVLLASGIISGDRPEEL